MPTSSTNIHITESTDRAVTVSVTMQTPSTLTEPLLESEEPYVPVVEVQDDPYSPNWLSSDNDQHLYDTHLSRDIEHIPEPEPTTTNAAYYEDDEPAEERPSCCWRLMRCLCRPVVCLLHRPVIPESDAYEHIKVQIRFVKFLLLTLGGVLITRLVVHKLDWEHRHGLTLSDLWLYDGNAILLDCIALFCVGRLHSHRLPVDHLAWMVPAMASSMYTSLLPNYSIFRHNFSLYELHCTWPWQLWLFVGCFVLPICSLTVVLHVRHARQQQQLAVKLVEVLGTAVLFLVPQIGQPTFDFHHYLAGLLCGMQSSYDTWFSRLTMAWCWGQYVNGIAVWGRDPPLQCAYAKYSSDRQNCGLEGSEQECWAPLAMGMVESLMGGGDGQDWKHCHATNSSYY